MGKETNPLVKHSPSSFEQKDLGFSLVDSQPISSEEDNQDFVMMPEESHYTTWIQNVWNLRFMNIIEIKEDDPWPNKPLDATKAEKFWNSPTDYFAKKEKKKLPTNPAGHMKKLPQRRGQAQLTLEGLPVTDRSEKRSPHAMNDGLVIGTALHKFVDFVHAGDEILGRIGVDPERVITDTEYAIKAFTEDWLSYLHEEVAKKKDITFIAEFDRIRREGKLPRITQPIDTYLTMHRESGAEVLDSEGRFAFWLQSNKHPYQIDGGRKRREIPLMGRFDQIRKVEDRIQVFEAKTSTTAMTKDATKRQIGFEFLGFQEYWRRSGRAEEFPSLQEDPVSMLYIPELYGYDFSTGQLHEMQIEDLGVFIESFRNMLFFTRILMEAGYGEERTSELDALVVGINAEDRKSRVKIGTTMFTLDECYEQMRKYQQKYLESFLWLPVNQAAKVAEQKEQKDEREMITIFSHESTKPKEETLPEIRFFTPKGREESHTPRFITRQRQPFKWQLRIPETRATKGKELGGVGTPQQLQNRVLARNGIIDEQIETYVNPDLHSITIESVQIDRDEVNNARNRILNAFRNEEDIYVLGHSDMDGIAGTVLITEMLERMREKVGRGGVIRPLFPEVGEGYGLTTKIIDRITSISENAEKKLIITVDNGISAHSAIDYAQEAVSPIDVIVVDHHPAPEKMVNAQAIIHTRELSAGGIAYVLAEEFAPSRTEQERNKRLELASLALFADMVPMTDSRRVIAKYGAESLKNPQRRGLQQLGLSVHQASGHERVREYDMFKFTHYYDELKYKFIPYINAVGKIGDPMDSYNLLRVNDEYSAAKYVDKHLDAHSRRRNIVEYATQQAKEYLNRVGVPDRLIVLATNDQTFGTNSLIAQKLLEEYQVPTIVLSRHGDVYSGSSRSVRGFDIQKALQDVEHLLESAGGHPEASGLVVRPGNLLPFKRALAERANSALSRQTPQRTLFIDGKLNLRHLNEPEYRAIEAIGPFGKGNELPLWETDGVAMLTHKSAITYFGKENEHVKLLFQRGGSREVKGIGFNLGPMVRTLLAEEKEGGKLDDDEMGVDIVYSLALDPDDPGHGMLMLQSLRRGTIKAVKATKHGNFYPGISAP